mgnify:CR=1 FL=1
MPFAPVHFKSGPIVVNFGVDANNLTQLGFSEDGVTGIIQPFFDEVKSDDNGGLRGPPSDAQLLGAIASLDVDFTKYIKAEMDKLSAFKVNGTAGILPAVGSFVRQDALGGVLRLSGIHDTFTFNFAFIRRNFEFNTGTRYRKYKTGWECWMSLPDYNQISQAQTRTLFTIT